MTAEQLCVQCKATVENVHYTGILCESCYDEQNAPPTAWRDYLTGPTVTGLIGGGLPFVLSFTLNNVNFVAAAGGAVALGAGGFGLMLALKRGDAGKKQMIGSIAVIGLGLVQLFRSAFWLLL